MTNWSIMFESAAPLLEIPDESDRIIPPPLEEYTSLLIKNNFWSILNIGAKYHVIDLALRDLNDHDTPKIVLRGKQSLSFVGVRPSNIDLCDESNNVVFQIHFLTGSSTCFPVLRGVRVVDTYGTTLGHIQEDSSICAKNDFIIKDYANKITYSVTSKLAFCEGPDFIVREKDNQITALVYRKGLEFVARYANPGISPSIKALIVSFCLFLSVRGTMRFSNACMKP